MSRWLTCIVVTGLTTIVPGCSDHYPSVSLQKPPGEPESVPYIHTVVPWLSATTDDWFLVDSGTPRTLVQPTSVGLPPDFFGEHCVSDLAVGQRDLSQQNVVITGHLPARMQAAVDSGDVTDIGGILGADVLFAQPFSLDPLRERFTWRAVADSGAMRIPVEVAGGGRTCVADGQCFEFGATRMLVDVQIGEASYVALVDTASTFVVAPSRLLERFAGPSLIRRTMEDGTRIHFARVQNLRAGEANATDIPLAFLDDIDTALARLQVETGRRVELLLGHSFFTRYISTFDAPGLEIRLIPYEPPPSDTISGVGISLRAGDGCYVVSALVEPSSAAEEGLLPGDCIERFDDGSTVVDAAQDPLSAALQLLRERSIGDRLGVTIRPEQGGPQRVELEYRRLL